MQKISVLIPVFNEAERLEIIFQALAQAWPKRFKLQEVLFVDDGSTDQTARLIKKQLPFLRSKLRVPVKLLSYQVNRGKGHAVKVGLQAATGDLLLLTDVDMSTPFSELQKFFARRVVASQVMVGTRKNGKSTVLLAQPLYRQIMGKGFTYLTQLLLGIKISDFTCGFKLFERKAYQTIAPMMKINRWGYDAEILYLAKKYQFTMTEVPVSWSNDERSKVNLLRDVVKSLLDLLAIRLYDWRGSYTLVSDRDTLKTGLFSWLKA